MAAQRGVSIQLIKEVDGKVFRCTVEEYSDGSVYVRGDEYELIVEFTDDALSKAIEQLTERGYVREHE
jgi:hypothetical protein